MDAATNVITATGAIADIQTTDAVVGTAGTTDKLTLTTAGAYTTGTGATGFEQLVLANGTNTITMANAATGKIVATATAGNYNVITGGTGFDTVIGTASVADGLNAVNLSTVTGIEMFKTGVAAVGNDWTFSGAAMTSILDINGIATQAVLGNVVGNSITVINQVNATTAATITSGTQIDTVTVGAGFTGALGVLSTDAEVINTSVAGTQVTLTAATGTQTVNANGGATLVLSAAQQSVNLGTGTNAGTDVITTTGSLVTSIDTVTGFASGTDTFEVGTVATQALTTATAIASSTLAGLAGNITNAVNAAATALAANWDSIGDVVVVTVTAGEAAGTYAVVNANTNATFDSATDFVIKLVGNTGTLTVADFV